MYSMPFCAFCLHSTDVFHFMRFSSVILDFKNIFPKYDPVCFPALKVLFLGNSLTLDFTVTLKNLKR